MITSFVRLELVDKELYYKEEPIFILSMDMRELRTKVIPCVKVPLMNNYVKETTCKKEMVIYKQHLPSWDNYHLGMNEG